MGEQPIFEAIELADAGRVKELAAAEDARECRLEDGRTPVMAAACAGDLAVFKLLVDMGADVNAEDVGSRNAFLCAAAEGHLAIVEAILSADDTQIFAATKSGNTALHRAAAYGHASVVSALLRAGADIDCVNEDGATALCRACRWGHGECAAALLRAGADPAIPDASGKTPLGWARVKGFDDTARDVLATRPVPAEVSATANAERVKALLAGEDAGEEGAHGDGEEDGEGSSVRVEGWMAKQGHIIRNWKNRWFVLDGRKIFYFLKEGATRPKGVIRMIKGTEVVVEEKYSKPFCFTLQTPKKKFILQAASEEEQAEWIEAIQINLETVPPEEAEVGGEADGPEDE